MSCSPGKCVAENHKYKKKEKKESPDKTLRSDKHERTEKTESSENGETNERQETKAGTEDVSAKKERKIIRPRFSKDLWMELLSREESEKVVGDIMEYQMQRVMAGNLLVDIKRQRENYTAYWARNYILQKVTQELTCRDEGEGPEESTRTEDSELEPLAIDMWAPRCVPARQVAPTPEPTEEEEPEVETVGTQPVAGRTPKLPATRSPDRTTALPEPTHLKNHLSSLTKQTVRKTITLPPASEANRDASARKSPPPASETRRDTDSDSAVTHRPASLPTRTPVKAFDPSSFPHHWIVPECEITDKPCTKHGHKRAGGLAKFTRKTQTYTDGDTSRAIDLRHGISNKDSDRK